MSDILETLATAKDLVLFLLGFGLIVFVHELGHFLAARWAGVRVLAFAIGFGKALLSYRKGLGLRMGSSEPEYIAVMHSKGQTLQSGSGGGWSGGEIGKGISPTEYRLNFLPFGGYVKMLGQEDLDPAATSSAPDSYQQCSVYKRMCIICAGVVMNLIFAAVVFAFVFSVGLKVEPPMIGSVAPNSPAAKAVAFNASELGVTAPGLRAGDRVISIDGRTPNTFQDIMVGAAMSDPSSAVNLRVERDGVGSALDFRIKPEKDALSGLLAIGVDPARSTRLPALTKPLDVEQFRSEAAQLGYPALQPGMRLVSVDGDENVRTAHDLERAVQSGNGRPITAVFEEPGSAGGRVSIAMQPSPLLMSHFLPALVGVDSSSDGGAAPLPPVEHLMGLMPVMTVRDAAPNRGSKNASDQGIRNGDVFLRVGTIEYPGIVRGMAEIRAHAGTDLSITVARSRQPTDASGFSSAHPLRPGSYETVNLVVHVSREGRIGFLPGSTADFDTLVARVPSELLELNAANPTRREPRSVYKPSAASVLPGPGVRIRRIEGAPVANFKQLRQALRDATVGALGRSEDAVLRIEYELASAEGGAGDSEPVIETAAWSIPAAEIQALHSLGWESPLPAGAFELEQLILKRDSLTGAVALGLAETRRVMATTYLTFARLFQRTVKVEHLKGPVGIAHMGTLVAEKGSIWLLFFLALISVNLAVINFLPLPIVDGGQFLLLVFEALRGRPAPVQVQNGFMLAGLVLIGCIFLVVTFNDIKNLFGL